MLVLLLGANHVVSAADAFEARPSLTLKHKLDDKLTLRAFYRNDMANEFSDTFRHTFKLGVSYDAYKHLSFAVMATYQKQRKDDWEDKYRLELEATYRVAFDYVKFSLRNRLEARRTASGDHHDPRIRHKAIFIFPFPGEKPFLKSVFISWEGFLSLDDGQSRFDQQRFEPLGVVLNLNESVSLKLYGQLIYLRDRNSRNWTESKVVGMGVTYKF